MSDIIQFLKSSGTDDAGRNLAQVLAFDDAQLERHHDFIQWLFPLPEASAAVPGSPVLTFDDIAVLKGSPSAQAALSLAADRMRRFYADTDHWLVSSHHNHLRITRIIKSLRLLAGDTAANQFRKSILEKVERTKAPVSATSRRYWQEA